MRTRDIISVINNLKKAKAQLEKMNKVYPKRYVEELYLIGDEVITQWYSSYDPFFYDRRGSLYEMFEVKLDGTNYIVKFNNDNLGGFEEYIYNLTFIEGYHGGARGGENHPKDGVPYWRTPYPFFSRWGRPALRSFSPYYRMVNRMKTKIKEIDTEKQKEYDQIIEKAMKSINKLKY